MPSTWSAVFAHAADHVQVEHRVRRPSSHAGLGASRTPPSRATPVSSPENATTTHVALQLGPALCEAARDLEDRRRARGVVVGAQVRRVLIGRERVAPAEAEVIVVRADDDDSGPLRVCACARHAADHVERVRRGRSRARPRPWPSTALLGFELRPHRGERRALHHHHRQCPRRRRPRGSSDGQRRFVRQLSVGASPARRLRRRSRRRSAPSRRARRQRPSGADRRRGAAPRASRSFSCSGAKRRTTTIFPFTSRPS